MKTVRKTLILAACAMLLVCATVVGTLAWLTDKTDPVVNTFTVGNIDITLAETTENYKMVPGNTIDKDPTATVKEGSEDCYLFVKLEKSANFDNFMTYTVADGWTQLPDVDGVYYRKVTNVTEDQSFGVLAGDQVQVKDEVTKEQMDGLKEGTYPTLTVTAYASQLMNGETEFTAAEAWEKVNPQTNA